MSPSSAKGNPPPRSAAAQKQDRRAKAAALRAEQEARERRRRNLIAGVVGAVVLAIIVGVGIAIQASRNSNDESAATPSGVTAAGGVVVGDADAPVDITVYEDFQCPVCKNFEAQSGDTLAGFVADGTAKVTYQPIAFLDRNSTDNYSTRALNAAACVVDTSPDSFSAFHEALFVNQTPEGGPGLTAEKLTELANTAGDDDPTLSTCISDLRFEDWTRTVTEAASVDGVNATPTVLVNGEPLDDPSPAGLTAAVQAASAG